MATENSAKSSGPPPVPGAAGSASADNAASPPPVPSAKSPPPLPQRKSVTAQAMAERLAGVEAAPATAKPAAEPAPAAAGNESFEDDEPEQSEPETGARRVARRRPAGPSRNRIAANDDAPSIGGLIYALNQKPSNNPFIYAAFSSGVWAAIGLGFGWVMVGPDLMAAKSLTEVVTKSSMLTAVATLLGPIALFWFLAMLAWRAEELKLRSSAMTEVAVRLAEPDRMAEQSVASLGQAVRRQVSFMNDAVARALGRAGELEALVHNEVASLERSYEDNERKIRGLIQELSGERSALLNTSERVSDTLRHLGLEVPALIDKLSQQQIKLAGIIEGAGENLTNLETALATRTDALGHVLEHSTAAIDTSIANRTQALQGVFEEYTRALDTTLANRAQALDLQLVERTKSLDDAFAERLRLFDESVLRSTAAIDGAMSDKAQALSSAMETHARNLHETIGRQAIELDESLMHGINAVRRSSESITRQSIKAIEGLANQSDLLKNVSENLLGQINNVTNRFEGQGQAIMRAANALETANYKIDLTLQQRHAELSQTLDRMAGKADDLSRTVQGYSSTLEGSMVEAQQRARMLTDDLTRDAEARSRSALADIERLKQEAGAHTERAMEELRNRFSTVSQEMSTQIGSLASNAANASGELRDQAARAAAEIEREQARLRSEFERLPAASRENTEAMRRSLQDQLRALEQLSNLTAREAARRDISMPVDPAPGPARTALPAPEQRSRSLSSLSATLSNDLAARARPAEPAPAALQSYPAHHPQQGQPMHPQAMAAAQQAVPGQDPREGWKLGELLARASRDDEPAGHVAPQQPMPASGSQGGPLDISILARALDPATASAIWSRFRAGQRGIMVRSIYTAEGRVAFDEVSRRYRVDPEFQASVNRYIADFERILQETEQRDQTGRMVQNQLISDSGRVYLFLAHVCGRLA